MIDLHIHSSASDGTFSPEEVYGKILESGVTFFSLTDHDTVAGIPEIYKVLDENKTTFIPGIEITVSRSKGECHLLGYNIDYNSVYLESMINFVQAGREKRNKGIADLLNSKGMAVDYQELVEKSGTATLGRPHFAAYLKSKGYVKSIQEAFDKYLAVGRPCYLENSGVEFNEAVNTVIKAGGIPVLAHPLSLYLSWGKLEEQLSKWKELGLKGIEVYHSSFRTRDSQRMEEIADRLGFLTACPTNLGTGMRASTMLFLPALKLAGAIETALKKFVMDYELTVRGVYGEGSGALGDMYQLSNTRTLGVDEESIIEIIERATAEMCLHESRAREKLAHKKGAELYDKICRSYGILLNAYMLSSAELMNLISDVKLGVILNILPLKDTKPLDKLLVLCSAANLTLTTGECSPTERDITRARLVKGILKEVK